MHTLLDDRNLPHGITCTDFAQVDVRLIGVALVLDPHQPRLSALRGHSRTLAPVNGPAMDETIRYPCAG